MPTRMFARAWSMSLAAALCCAGCQAPAPSPHGRPNSADLGTTQAQRAEQVFRLQNRVMDDLISQTMSRAYATTSDFSSLEDQMIDSCSALNEAAGMQTMGTSPGALLKLRVLASLSQCEDSARAARAAMMMGTLPER